jgi:hypothetical protein
VSSNRSDGYKVARTLGWHTGTGLDQGMDKTWPGF